MNERSNKGFWDNYAFLYDIFMRKDKVAYDKMLARIREILTPDMDVLELATGTGILAVGLADYCRTLEATDYSDNMIQAALRKPHPDNLRFAIADATALPYESQRFDVVVIANALHIMPEPEKALENIRRVLRDDGLLIAPTFARSGKLREAVLEKPMELAGFHTYSRWRHTDYLRFLMENGWKITCSEQIRAGFPLSYVVVKKK